jgi:hypothetical protein
MNETMSIDQYRERLRDGLLQFGLPRHVWESLTEYIIIGRPTGEFLAAVLSNNLTEAVTRADALNLPRLPDYVLFLANVAPATCHGSQAAFTEWMRLGGVLGRQQRATEQKGLVE